MPVMMTRRRGRKKSEPVGDAFIFIVNPRYTYEQLVVVATKGSVIVDWGDGNTETIESIQYGTSGSHVYDTVGEYTVKIKGSLDAIQITGYSMVTTIVQWGNLNLIRASYMFSNQNRLYSILQPSITGMANVTDMSNMFFNCSALTSIPETLFDNCPNVTTFANIFSGTRITNIPETLFNNCLNVTNFSGAFAYTYISNIPEKLFIYNTKVLTFFNVFSYCRYLEEIPEKIFENNYEVTNFAGVFRGCSIEDVPTALFRNNQKVDTFSSAFYGCSSLTYIPDGLFENHETARLFSDVFSNCTSVITVGDRVFNNCSSATDFFSVFASCSKLTTVGADVFKGCTSAVSFRNLFINCSLLAVVGSDIFSDCINAQNFEGVFRGTSIVEIGENIFANCPKATTFSYAFYSSKLAYIPETLFTNCYDIVNIASIFEYTNIQFVPSELFMGRSKLTTITNCFNLTPVTEIGDSVFENCTSLVYNSLGMLMSSLYRIGNNLFKGCSSIITATALGAPNIRYIGDSMYEDCTALTKVSTLFIDIRNSEHPYPVSFGSRTFKNCTSLLTLYTHTFAVGNISFGDETFMNCRKLSFEGDWTLVESGAAFTYNHPCGFIFVWEFKTYNSDNPNIPLYTRTPTNSVTFGNSTFENCYALKANVSIIATTGRTMVGDRTFANCISLTRGWVYNEDGRYHVGLLNGSMEYLYQPNPGSINWSNLRLAIPSDLIIGDYTFAGCTALTDIVRCFGVGFWHNRSTFLTLRGHNHFEECFNLDDSSFDSQNDIFTKEASPRELTPISPVDLFVGSNLEGRYLYYSIS